MDYLDPRVMDPGRGAFCATTKSGHPLNAPPMKRDPVTNREKNPKGVRHLYKSAEDLQPVQKRRRYQEWLKRQEAMR